MNFKPTLCIDTHELAWAAGFFDGEGCITHRRDRAWISIAMSVSQSDRQPLDRFQRAVGGIGVVRGPYRQKASHHKPYWVWSTDNQERSQAVIGMLWKWLSEPKRADAERVLGAVHARQRVRIEFGAKGRAKLSATQASDLRANYAKQKLGRLRVPRGFFSEEAARYSVSRHTLAHICKGRGYV
jgi:hypothetical protein